MTIMKVHFVSYLQFILFYSFQQLLFIRILNKMCGKEDSKMIFRSDWIVFKLLIQKFSSFQLPEKPDYLNPKFCLNPFSFPCTTHIPPSLPFTKRQHFGLATITNHWTFPFKCSTKIVSNHSLNLRKKKTIMNQTQAMSQYYFPPPPSILPFSLSPSPCKIKESQA